MTLRIFSVSVALLFAGCSSAHVDATADGLGAARAAVATEVPDCSVASASGYVAATGVLTVTVPAADTLEVAPAATEIRVNGRACVDNLGRVLAPTALTAIVINGTAGDDTVIVDVSRAPLPANVAGVRGGGVRIDLGAGTLDTLRVVGTSSADTMTAGAQGSRAFLDVDGDGYADLRWTSTAQARELALFLGAGDDRASATGTSLTTPALPLQATAKVGGTPVALGTMQSLGFSARVFGMDGADRLAGGNGDDTLDGGAGDDTFVVAATVDGADRFVGDVGVDVVDYGARTAPLTVSIAPTSAADANDGLAGENDDVTESVEEVRGGSGNDDLRGNERSNVLRGGPGADTLWSGPAGVCATDSDQLFGDEGNDVFEMGDASDCADRVSGGAGYDVVTYHDRLAGIAVRLDDAANDGATGEGDDIRGDVEELVGGDGNDVLEAGTSALRVSGCGGDDTIRGSSQNDELSGGPGDDVVSGLAGDDRLLEWGEEPRCLSAVRTVSSSPRGLGRDVLNGGVGALDLADYQGRAADLTLTLCTDTATASGLGTVCAASRDDGEASEGDALVNVEVVEGGAGNDTMRGTSASEWLSGNGGDDLIDGRGGDDTLDGGSGVNALTGGSGAAVCANYTSSFACEVHVYTCNGPRLRDCDGVPENACETDITASTAHCGACGLACAANQSCTAGVCQ